MPSIPPSLPPASKTSLKSSGFAWKKIGDRWVRVDAPDGRNWSGIWGMIAVALSVAAATHISDCRDQKAARRACGALEFVGRVQTSYSYRQPLMALCLDANDKYVLLSADR